MSSEHGCSGIINVKCSNHPSRYFSTIFETLAMSLFMKARDMQIQVIRHSINVSNFNCIGFLHVLQYANILIAFYLSAQPNNVKRDAHMGARDVQYIQKALRNLGLADRVVSMAKATLHSRDYGDSSGFLLVFPHKTLFYESTLASLQFRKKHLRVFFKDVLSVTSLGDTLTITVLGEHQKELKQRGSSCVSLGGSGNTATANNVKTGRRGSELLAKPVFGPSSTARGAKSRVTDRFRNINDVGTTVTSFAGQARLSVQYKLRGENECLEIKAMISQRVNEIKRAMTNGFQKDSNSFSNYKGQGQIHMFGYTMPGEILQEDGLEAVDHILSHAKSCSYRPGDEILRRGCTERRLFHITAGTAVCTSENGQVTARMGPGEVMGVTTFLDTGDVGTEEAIVAEDALECLVVARDTVEMLAALHPEAGARFWRSLAVSAAYRLRGQWVALEARGRELEAAALQHSCL